MFAQAAIPGVEATPDQVYVEKLRAKLRELSVQKDNAVAQEDFVNADQLRIQVNVLQTQLSRMEDQSKADLLQNCVSQWQQAFADDVLEKFKGGLLSMTQRDITVALLSSPYHKSFINILSGLAPCYYEAVAKAFIILLPQDVPEIPKSPYGWEFLARRIPGFQQKPLDIQELVKASAFFLIMDVIQTVVGRATEHNITKETEDLILKHIFHYFHVISLRKLNAEYEGRLFEKTFGACAMVLGDIAQHSPTEILRYSAFCLDASRKTNPEEIILVLSSTRYCFKRADTQEDTAALMHFIREIVSNYDRNRKTGVKMAIIQTLERVIQPQYADDKHFYETTLWQEIIPDLYRRVRKWSATDDLKETCLHLMAVILVNAPIDFYAKNIDGFINTDLCPKRKVRSFAYSSLHQLLCGRFYHDTRDHAKALQMNAYEVGARFGHTMRKPGEQSYGNIVSRLNAIAEMTFLHRTNSRPEIPDEYLDISVDIALQIASHSIMIGIKLIAQLLDTTRVESAPWAHFIGLRALRTILDPDSGFQEKAFSRNDPEFAQVLVEFPAEMEAAFATIYGNIDTHIGVNVLGSNGYVVEQIVAPLQEREDKKEEFRISGVGQGSTMLEMLNNSFNETLKEESRPFSLSNQNLNRDSILSPTGSNNNLSILDNYRESYRRSMTLSLFATNPVVLDVSTREANEKVGAVIQDWFKLIQEPKKEIEKYNVASHLYDSKRMKRKNQLRYKPEQQLAQLILMEILRLLKFVPAPEFVGGSLFVGQYLNHPRDEVVLETAHALHYVFKNYAELRVGIINGFINFLKNSPHQDDICVCTVILLLARLIKTWQDEIVPGQEILVHQEAFYRVSCKLDAMMLIFLARPNPRIRQACLQILYDFYALQNTFSTHGSMRGEMPLAAILVGFEQQIVKNALFAFFEKGGQGSCLNARTAPSFRLLTFFEVASSGFSVLFQYYLAQLGVQFAEYGRPKAVRHCAKFLRLLAIPYIGQAIPEQTQEYLTSFLGLMFLLMALAGIPMSSDTEPSTEFYEQSHGLLLASFKNMVPQILIMDHNANSSRLMNAFYHLHPQVIGLFLQELFDSFAELRHNQNLSAYEHVLENIVHVLRRIAQSAQFPYLVQMDPMHKMGIIEIYADFLSHAGAMLGDLSFLSKGSVNRLRMAVNYCIIVQKLSGVIRSYQHHQQQLMAHGEEIDHLHLQRSLLSVEVRRGIFGHMKEWYEIIMEIGPSAGSELKKPGRLRYKLLERIGQATAGLMQLGPLFEAPSTSIYSWLTALETDGFRVFVPNLLYSFEEALGTVLANCYAGNGFESPFVFAEPIFDQILPTLYDGPKLFLETSQKRMTFAEDYLASLHMISPSDPDALDSIAFVYPDITRDDALSLRKHVGSLVFFGLYSLMSKSKHVRTKSLLFLKELLQMFNPDDDFDVEAYFAIYHGGFYSASAQSISQKALEISAMCSELFAEEAPSFMWEAVRCSRSVEANDTTYTIVPSHSWLGELITPWCEHVDFSSMSHTLKYTDLFKFLVDFWLDDKPGRIDCFKALVKSKQFGEQNTFVLVDTLVKLHSQREQAQATSLSLICVAFEARPEWVGSILCEYLSATAFPWSTENRFTKHGSSQFIKQYLYPSDDTQGGMKAVHFANALSAASIVSELVTLDYAKFEPYLHLMLNFSLCSMGVDLKEQTPPAKLLESLVNAFVAMTFKTKATKDPKYSGALSSVRKLLGWLELEKCEIMWSVDQIVDQNPFSENVSVADLLTLIIDIFVTWKRDLMPHFVKETLVWLRDGYLDPQRSSHSLKIYTVILQQGHGLEDQLLDPLLERLFDQISVLRQVEGSVQGGQPLKLGWERLPQGVLELKESAESMMLDILYLDCVLIARYQKSGTLYQQDKIFWAIVGYMG
ncbi:hypothetical protein EDD86DRAFT_208959 [Gorgonomyces haynaldii]|nr:hypothetical protein EDD86DRAFT_208959 [Gorgonomyces haynaldii]